MKKLIGITLLISQVINANSQTIQATIKPGSQPNSIIVAIRPSATINAAKISSVSIAIAVPATANPRPAVTIKNNFNSSISYDPQVVPAAENVPGKGSYFVVNFLGDGAQGVSAERVITAGVDNDLVEFEFTGGPVSTAEVLMVNVPNGGTTSQSNFYIADRGTARTNQSAMFYGSTATNGPGGEAGTSFVTANNIALPVKFLSFVALKSGDDAKLSWTVENDADNRYFELQRSKDGKEFKSIVKVDALANGKSVNTYALTDARISNVGGKMVYYRIKQVDKDGTVTYSSIRNLGIERNGIAVNIFPNPARSITKLVFDAQTPGRGNVLIRDMNGKLIQQVATQFIAGVNQQELNVSNLAAGEYNVTITGTGYDHTLKLTKVN